MKNEKSKNQHQGCMCVCVLKIVQIELYTCCLQLYTNVLLIKFILPFKPRLQPGLRVRRFRPFRRRRPSLSWG